MAECVPFVTEVSVRQRTEREDGWGARCGHTIENDKISNLCYDFLRLEDQAGVLSGAVTADYDGYRLG